ncbi:MAG: hypothetical protein ACOY3P_09720 [Planctomycetota bacterium]
MLDFRQTAHSMPPTARRDERRLIWLFFGLGLVLLMASWIVRPGGLTVLDRMFNAGPAEVDRPFDNRLERAAEPAGSDTIVAPPRRAAEPTDTASDEPEEPARRPRYPMGVMPNYLDEVRDDTYFRPEESNAFFNLLDVLRRMEESQIEQASKGRVTYAQLFRQSDAYRGQIVTMVGTVRRVELMEPVPKNDVGVTRYYRLWLTPADNPSMVTLAYVLDLPPEFPAGDGLAESVELSGFYFKRWAYAAQEDLLTTPTLLAKTIDWRKAPTPATEPVDTPDLFWVVAAAAFASALLVTAIYLRTRRGSVRPIPPERFEGDLP